MDTTYLQHQDPDRTTLIHSHRVLIMESFVKGVEHMQERSTSPVVGAGCWRDLRQAAVAGAGRVVAVAEPDRRRRTAFAAEFVCGRRGVR